MFTTWLDNNSWLWEIADQKILVDPWLSRRFDLWQCQIGYLRVKKSKPFSHYLMMIDFHLADSGVSRITPTQPPYKPSTSRFPLSGSPNAAKVVREFGFTDVTALDSW
jgi:L-ascorbate metabolism protein UlaG (beta-lactamase superfamily)